MSENRLIPRINSLPGSLVNQIAAGEVIERPASVVKELIENAIDSGAGRIAIEIEAGGTEKITIHDNGCGIHPDDIELAIHRHTTSKLQSLQDLDAINSLGFRGEALASIASISDFCIISRISGQEHALKLSFNPYNGRHEITPAAREPGTTVEIFRLFQPVPVRRKFLRSDKTEFLHIQEVVKRFILSRFDIDFSFYHNGKLIMSSPVVESDYRIRISGVMGSTFYNNAWQIDSQSEDMRLWGWLGNAVTARSQSDRQFLFLNNRIIRDKRINHAIRKVLSDMIDDARYPSYILHLFMEPGSVDVNVHPAKQEVRFKNPRNVHDFIYAVLSESIRQELPLAHAGSTGQPAGRTPVTSSIQATRAAVDLHDLKANYDITAQASPAREMASPLGSAFALLHGNYLLTRYGDDVRIVDYNNLRRYWLRITLGQQLLQDGIVQRPLLVPVMLTVKESVLTVILSNSQRLERLGITLVQSGPQMLSVRSIPASLPDIDIVGLILALSELLLSRQGPDVELENDLLGTVVEQACHSERHHYSLQTIKQELPLLVNLDLPFAEKKYASIWNTVSESELDYLVKDGK